MSFEMQSESDVLKRLKINLNETNNEASDIEGSFNSDMLSANSIEFSEVYKEINMVIEAGFADTSWGKFLTMRAAEFGVIRKEATKAIGKLKIVGEVGARIIKGSLFTTAQDNKFYSTEDAIIGATGTVTIDIEAGTAGAVGVVKSGTIVNIPMSIPNVISCINEIATYDGFDEENDKEFLVRYLMKVRTPATSGNKFHYWQWAMAVAGVGQAKVIPLWDGNGTVKVIIINSNLTTASAELIEKVADYIETVRPIGATVTTTSPAPKLINITANIKGVYDIEKIKQSINNYLKDDVLNMKYVSIVQIGKLLLENNGGTIKDYDKDSLLINGQSGNISLSDEELPVCGEVILNVV
ncbi:baseplate J/gp47 family protein [Anaerosinus massiliensis]|uniref:baseplate J/gp47 family protein n=1 Tax=Massilibacillus massiliensis TaxID=1806837 RepID=UPI000AF1F1B6|nr:baseplate J/gp47 family protein [Massilibacillus massiliensis]